MMSRYPMMDNWPMMGPFMWLFMLLFLGLALFGIIYLIRLLMLRDKSRDETPQRETALDILKKRYAKGEISREDYEQMKKDIS